MTFDSLLNRTLAVERPYLVPDVLGHEQLDVYGQPVTEYVSVTEEVKGRVDQRHTSREIALISQAGAVIADHTIFMRKVDISSADRIHDTTDGRVFEVLGCKDAGGAGHHWEIDAREIVSPALTVAP